MKRDWGKQKLQGGCLGSLRVIKKGKRKLETVLLVSLKLRCGHMNKLLLHLFFNDLLLKVYYKKA